MTCQFNIKMIIVKIYPCALCRRWMSLSPSVACLVHSRKCIMNHVHSCTWKLCKLFLQQVTCQTMQTFYVSKSTWLMVDFLECKSTGNPKQYRFHSVTKYFKWIYTDCSNILLRWCIVSFTYPGALVRRIPCTLFRGCTVNPNSIEMHQTGCYYYPPIKFLLDDHMTLFLIISTPCTLFVTDSVIGMRWYNLIKDQTVPEFSL